MTAGGLAITAEAHPIDLFSTFLSLLGRTEFVLPG